MSRSLVESHPSIIRGVMLLTSLSHKYDERTASGH
jgi:hypothetical protein